MGFKKFANFSFAFSVVFVITLLSSPMALGAAKSCRILLDAITVTEVPAVAAAANPPHQLQAAPPARPKRNVVETRAEITRELKAQDQALWKVNLQHFYESAVQFMQKRVTVSSVRSTLAQQGSRKLNLIHFLGQGKHNEAIDIYRRTFDKVELSFWTIKLTEQQLQSPNLTVFEKWNLQRRLLLNKRSFAQNYGEYVSVRQYLESVDASTNASPLYFETAERVLKNLGVHKFSEVKPDFAALRIPEQRVSLVAVKELFRSESQYTRFKLLADFRSEIGTALRYLVSSEILVGAVDSIINTLPKVGFKVEAVDKLKNLVGLMRSAQLRHRALPQIIEIENLPHDLDMRLMELRKKNSLTTHDELLVTYARTVEFTDTFNELKAHAAKKGEEPNNIIMKHFHERLLAAETRAAELPDISLYEKMSNIDLMYTLVQAGIVLKMTGPQVFNSFSDFFNYMLSAGVGLM